MFDEITFFIDDPDLEAEFDWEGVSFSLRWRENSWKLVIMDRTEFGSGETVREPKESHIVQLIKAIGLPQNIDKIVNIRLMSPEKIKSIRRCIDSIGYVRLKSVLDRWVQDDLNYEDYVGGGVWGHVFRFKSKSRSWAIKILVPPYDDKWMSRFRRETSIVNDLDTWINVPRLVGKPIFHEGIASYRMQYVESRTFSSLAMPLDTRKALELIRKACITLYELEKRGIVHRDLHLGNLALTPDERVFVFDFGLAKQAPFESNGYTFRPVGAMTHCAPEKWRSPKKASVPSDVFSVGVMLYRLLTGEYPFWESSYIDLYKRISDGSYIPVHERKPNISIFVSHLVSVLLSTLPGLRPQSHQDTINLIDSIYEHSKIRYRQIVTNRCPNCLSPADVFYKESLETASITIKNCPNCSFRGTINIDLL